MDSGIVLFPRGSITEELEYYKRGEINDPYYHDLIVSRINKEIWEKEHTESLIEKYGQDPRVFDKTKLCKDCRWAYNIRKKVTICGNREDDIRCLHPSCTETYVNLISGEVVHITNDCASERMWNAGQPDACHPFAQNWEPGSYNYKIENILDEDQTRKVMAYIELYKCMEEDSDVDNVRTCISCKWSVPGKWFFTVETWEKDKVHCSHPSSMMSHIHPVKGHVDDGMRLCKDLRNLIANINTPCGYEGKNWSPRG